MEHRGRRGGDPRRERRVENGQRVRFVSGRYIGSKKPSEGTKASEWKIGGVSGQTVIQRQGSTWNNPKLVSGGADECSA